MSGLNTRSLKAELQKLLAELENAQYTISINAIPDTLPAKTESALILICKEAVTNILKHSKGNRVDFYFETINNQLNLNITNNGDFNDAITWGNGLSGIKERCFELGGQFIAKISKQSFCVKIHLPTT